MALTNKNPVRRIFEVLKFEKKEISSIYFYAIMLGLVQLTLPLGIQAIISFVLGGAISTSLVLLIIFVVFGVFVNGLLQVNQMKIIEKIQQQLFVRYSFKYTHLLPNVDLKVAEKYYLPELVNRFFDVISLQKGISKLLLDIPAATIQIIFGLILLAFYHPAFILFGLIMVFILYLILRFTGYKGLQTSLEESDHKYSFVAHLEEMARSVSPFKFSDIAYHIRKADKHITNYLGARTAHFRILLVQYWTLVGFKLLITAAMLIVGAALLVEQQLNVGQFIAAEIVIILVINSVEKLIVNLDKVYDVITSLEKVNKVMDLPAEQNAETEPVDKEHGFALQVQGLEFGYDGSRKVLQDVSFDLGAGEKMLVSGGSGSGKSTLLKVLSGLYEEYNGRILVNDIPMHKYQRAALRSRVALMLQSFDVFEGTLAENILVGRDTPYRDMQRLANLVGLEKFVAAHPDAYDMKLKPTGYHLPANVTRKILLARALAGNPALLLLEEPFTCIEKETAERVLKYIEEQMPGTTLIMTTEHTQYVAACDKVLVLDGGRSIKFGGKEILDKGI